MRIKRQLLKSTSLMLAIGLCQSISFSAAAHTTTPPTCKLLTANRLFNGTSVTEGKIAVLIEGNKVKKVGKAANLNGSCKTKINLGDSTILPGFIESHAHGTFQNVRKDTQTPRSLGF